MNHPGFDLDAAIAADAATYAANHPDKAAAHFADNSDADTGAIAGMQYTYFEEADQVLKGLNDNLRLEATLVDAAAAAQGTDASTSNEVHQRLYHAYFPLNTTIAKYQAQPQLMDSHLTLLITPIMHFIRSRHFHQPAPPVIPPSMYEFLVNLANARGPKYIVKFFSHEVSDLEGLLALLAQVDRSQPHLWPVRYILLLWMSFVTMLPFQITRLEIGSGTQGESGGGGIVQRLLDAGKSFLGHTGKERDAAAMLVGRLVSRVDVAHEEVPKLMAWADHMLEASPNVFSATGVLQTLCAVLKFTDRTLLLPHTPLLISFLRFVDAPFIQRNALLRKLLVKYATRVALVMLRNKVPTWRYDRGSRSLQANILRTGASEAVMTNTNNGKAGAQKEQEQQRSVEELVPESTELIVDVLLNGLRDKDTIVRWSAAKGVGRLTSRLPHLLAQDVIDAILDLFNENVLSDARKPTGISIEGVSEHTWHGACLSLAELARRGLLLPASLPSAITWVSLALTFDHRRGAHSVGASVRDAACYVCWAFARAYAPDVMRPYVHLLAPMLVTAALYDREIHVRRAASAAFQENVGRQGIFPHGIDIVTAADFFTVGNRQAAYLVAAKTVAGFDEYHECCVEYLMANCVTHWDVSMRRVAAEGVGVVVEVRQIVVEDLVDRLIPLITSPDLFPRHGSILTLASILHAHPPALTATLQCRLERALRAIKPTYLSGFGSELTRESILRLGHVACSIHTGTPLTPGLVAYFTSILESSLERKEPSMHVAARDAAAAIVSRVDPQLVLPKLVLKWVGKTRGTRDVAELNARRGYSLALGVLDKLSTGMAVDVIDGVVQHLIAAGGKALADAEAKKNTVQSIGELVARYGAQVQQSMPGGTDIVGTAVRILVDALDDYTTTTHGDVGSWVRIAGMLALAHVLEAPAPEVQVDPAVINEAVAGCVHQALSKIDRVREVAGSVLSRVLGVPAVRAVVRDAGVLDQCVARVKPADWVNAADVLHVLVPLLKLPAYREPVLTGFILCMGGLTDSLVKSASQVLMDSIETMEASELAAFAEALVVGVLGKYRRKDRITVPALNALDILYANQALMFVDDEVHERVLVAVRDETEYVRKNVVKILTGFKVMGGLAGVPSTRHWAMRYLCHQLTHGYPRVRKGAAESMIASIPIYAQVCEEEGEPMGEPTVGEALEVLTSVDWTTLIPELKEAQAKLLEQLGVAGVEVPGGPLPEPLEQEA